MATLHQLLPSAPAPYPSELFEPSPNSFAARGDLVSCPLSSTRKRLRSDSTSSLTSAWFSGARSPPPLARSPPPLGRSPPPLARSPPPLASDRYELAGGLERPEKEDLDEYFLLEKQRRGLWTTPSSPYPEPTKHRLCPSESQQAPNGPRPWVLTHIFNIVGGVAGRLVQFCSTPFRGFQAGGGQKYGVDSAGHITAVGTSGTMANETSGAVRSLPGDFPTDDFGVASWCSFEDTPIRESKRLRTGEKWVVVEKNGDMVSRPTSPQLISERRISNVPKSLSPCQIPRPVSRASYTQTLQRRPSLIPVSRRMSMDRQSRPWSNPGQVRNYSTPRTYNGQNYASPAPSPSSKKSPLPAESQRLINQIRREEDEYDARMRRMSAQTAAMLREAQAALGSKAELDDMNLDED